MKPNSHYLAFCLALVLANAYAAPADHLVISEVAVKGAPYVNGYTSPEFVEIYNPTASPIGDLQNYYITDWSNYHLLPQHRRDGTLPNEGSADYVSQFPSHVGTDPVPPIPPGGVITVTANARQFLLAYFNDNTTSPTDFVYLLGRYTGQPGNPKLFETYDSMPEVPNMVSNNADQTSDGLNMGHSDAGENVFLIYYDGVSDNVKDVDAVMYRKVGTSLGTDNGFIPKSGILVDGPDADSIPTAYLTDAGNENNLSLEYASTSTGPYQVVRVSKFQPGEALTGGNGITGHDVSTEEASISFIGTDTTFTATAGIPDPRLAAVDQIPVIYGARSEPEIPMSNASFDLVAEIEDDASVASAMVHVSDGVSTVSYSMTLVGGTTWKATIPANIYPDRSVLHWYVTAIDNTLNSASQQNYAPYQTVGTPAGPNYTRVDNSPADGKLLINEIMFDPAGSDNSTNPEFIELYNKSGSALDLSGYKYVYGASDTYVFPSGTTIQPNGYLLLLYNQSLFQSKFPAVPTNIQIQMVDPPHTTSSIANSGTGTINLQAWDSTVIDNVSYRVTPPWPGNTVSGSGYAAQSTGYSIELINPDADNSDGANWIVSSKLGGTPGAGNFSVDSFHTPEYPAPGDAVTLTARISGIDPVTPGSVMITVEINGVAQAPVAMTDLGNNTFSYSLGNALPDRTFVTYNITAQNPVTNEIVTASPQPFSLLINSQAPLTGNDIIINEIMYFATGTENGAGNSEWIEFYNRRSTPVNLGHVLLGVDNYAGLVSVPEGFVVPAFSYFILAGNATKFSAQYPAISPASIINAGWTNGKLAHSGTSFVRVAVIDPNQVNKNRANLPADSAAYTITSPWPTSPAANFSIELKNINLDNNAGANWKKSSAGGTPGVSNSGASAINDWALY